MSLNDCKWCQRKPAVTTKFNTLEVCAECDIIIQKYCFCSVCNNPLTAEAANYNIKNFQTGVCSKECKTKLEVANGHLCCEKATYINCVCAYATICEVHGEKHVGTHD